ncbi:hypothetical protein ACQ4M4_11265 [Leptolyngbya sp. AN02str]|uniref:hypothetical protein n=1 Tax=Leptolyngbya sp. AN02str TaxID=3423363 RepID=UPI003D3123C1
MQLKPIQWEELQGLEVRVYRNLLFRTQRVMSVQTRQRKSWKLAGHTANIAIANVSFHVSEAGRQRVIREQCKNVHAWVQGLCVGETGLVSSNTISLTYDPYRDSSFVEIGSLKPISNCKLLVVREGFVYASPDALKQSEQDDLPLLSQLSLQTEQCQQFRSLQAIAA